MGCSYRFLVSRVEPFWIQLSYFISGSVLGFLLLKALGAKDPSNQPKDFDLFFTSVSAATVSSMATVEMEAFSNSQLIVITVLMFLGGEVFTSMLELHLMKTKFMKTERSDENRVAVLSSPSRSVDVEEPVELGWIATSNLIHERSDGWSASVDVDLRYNCIRYLRFVVTGYLLVVHVCGCLFILLYVTTVQSATEVLKKKGIKKLTFGVFTTVSSFTNCGFIPTNENMMVFKKNSGLLLLIIPQVLFGNTLFPTCLRLVVWVLRKATKKAEFNKILKNPKEIGFDQLLPPLHCLLLGPTVVGFILAQVILFCCMEWNLEALSGMSSYEKIVGALFQSANTRHAGESIVDISSLAPAILVLYVLMMYLPPYTSFLPVLHERDRRRNKAGMVQSLILSQLSYPAICILLVCIIENKNLSEDPINFSVLNIIVEVISAYGNVGFSTGYSCQKRLKVDSSCKDAWYGFVGRWSTKGKLILIFVMFLGRLKKFNLSGGRAWKLR